MRLDIQEDVLKLFGRMKATTDRDLCDSTNLLNQKATN